MSRWKKSSKLTSKELDDVADFFEKFVTTTPPDMLRRGVGTAGGSPGPPRLHRLQQGGRVQDVSRRMGRAERRGPEPLRLGLAAMDRPNDPQAGRAGPLRFPGAQGPDARLQRRPVDRERCDDADPLPQEESTDPERAQAGGRRPGDAGR